VSWALRAILVAACWFGYLNGIASCLGLIGCAHPQPPPPPPQEFILKWDNLNSIPVCTVPAVYPCQTGQVVTPGNVTLPITEKTYTGQLVPGTQYTVVIYAYSPTGVLTASRPSTVTIP
jgi:hypothetical protein